MTPLLTGLGANLAAEGDPNPLLPHTSEIIVGIIAFVLLYFFLARKVFPLFEKTYRQRTDLIEGGLQRADEAQREAKRTLAEYRAQLAQARAEAAQLREEARVQGQSIIEELRQRAQQEAAGITSRAEARIEADRAQAFAELRAEIGLLAVDLSGRIVGESLRDDNRQRRVVDRFLDDLARTADRDGAGVGVGSDGAAAGGEPAGAAPADGEPGR
jgi:F-type H+-transporting ATPase subunit b